MAVDQGPETMFCFAYPRRVADATVRLDG